MAICKHLVRRRERRSTDAGGFKGAKRNKRERERSRRWSREWRSRKRGSWSSFMQMKESDKMQRGRMHARKNERNAFYRNQKVVRIIATHRPTGPRHPWAVARVECASLRNETARETSSHRLGDYIPRTCEDIEYDRDCAAPISSRLSAYWW